MDEQFILRVPPSVAEHIDCLLSENASSSEDKSFDLVFSGEDLALDYRNASLIVALVYVLTFCVLSELILSFL